MLKAGPFDDFKGKTTLLLWDDGEGMHALLTGLRALLDADRATFLIEGLTIGAVKRGSTVSLLEADGNGLRWTCSIDLIALAADLVEPLLTSGAGHQFLDVNGLAKQVMIARDEYPVDLRASSW